MNYDEIIKRELIRIHTNEDIFDKWNQVSPIHHQPGSIIKDSALEREITTFVESGNSKVVQANTYSNGNFQYKSWRVIDRELDSLLYACEKTNPHRRKG